MNESVFYKVYSEYGDCRFCNRDSAFDYFESHKGYKIETYDSIDNPTIKVIVDEKNFNIERIRKDLTIKKTSEALRKAITKYDKQNTKQINLKLNKITDKEILDYLDRVENKQGIIKEVLKEYIEKNIDKIVR